MRVSAYLVLALFALAGCLPVPRTEEVKLMTLEADFTPSATQADGPALLVALPRARAGYDSAGMAYWRAPQELAYFARHRWVDTPPRMLAPLLVQALEASGGFSAVLAAPAVARAGLRLDTEVLRLRQNFSTSPSRVELVLRAQLSNVKTAEPVATRTFAATVPCAADDPVRGAEAANQAVRLVLTELAQWAAETARR
ncbi:ABC-type transport auxiliary lipoprotein family protein [Thiobacter aerophilum]|uniref:ABC-type transport auxiliary lipoprotein family protein n=1 Tax=Thiobacter aerophilum TaxID=3121275 RepID=A0ABV0EEM0_9BURK